MMVHLPCAIFPPDGNNDAQSPKLLMVPHRVVEISWIIVNERAD